MRLFKVGLLPLVLAMVSTLPVQGSTLFIVPTFDSSITSDPNASAIEATINSAISTYAADFSNPITVDITFEEMSSGLGSNTTFFETIPYATYCNALVAHATTTNDASAVASLLVGGVCPTTNPVTGSSSINVKTPNLRALGLLGPPSSPDGTVMLNTSITTPGSPGSTLSNSLISVVEHEMDEVLGLGSAMPNTSGGTIGAAPSNSPFPEDLFRFTAGPGGTRTFSAGSPCSGLGNAFFSINGGTTDLAQFNNACNGGDFGDWAVVGSPKVQDWQATAGATPSLGVELVALDVIGYDLVGTPEPGTFVLVGSALLSAVFLRRRAIRTRA